MANECYIRISFLASTDVCINGRQLFLHGPTSELLVCNLPLNANVSNSMKQLAEQEWGIHNSKITLIHKGKKIKDNHNAALFLHDSNIYVSIKQCLSGGGEECEICGGMAQYYCDECKQEFCADCCSRVHQHKKRTDHKPCKILPDCDDSDYASCSQRNTPCTVSQMPSHSSADSYEDDNDDDCFSNEEIFTQAMMIATLAEHFNLTEFKPFQKEVINNLLGRNDCLVIQPTGSGKSLCFQFPAIYGKKTVIGNSTNNQSNARPGYECQEAWY